MLRPIPEEDDHPQSLLTRILRDHFEWGSAEIIAAIEAGAEYMDLPAGATLFEQGEVGDDIYFLLSGRMRATSVTPDGDTRVLGEVGRGETIGELALFTGEPRSASVQALRDSTVARVSRHLLERAISQAPEVALGLMRRVIERFRQNEAERPARAQPVTICLLPVSPGIDALDFARALRARQPQSVGSIAVLSAAQLALTPEMKPVSPVWRRHGIVSRILDEAEQENAAVYLVADHADSAWTRFCLQHADEVLMLADASADPALSVAEAELLQSDASVSMARQTLVLLHAAETRSPRGTARWLEPRNRPRHFHIRPTLEADMARLARIVSGRAIGLVFAGGGARGFAHVGVYQALEEAGIEIDFIGGSSIGALMGTMVALDMRGDAMRQGVHEAFLNYPGGNITGDFSPLPLLSLIRGDRSRDSLARSIRRHAGEEIDMEDSWKTFFVIASNFSAGSEEVLRDGPIVRNVTASFAIPGVLPPVLRDGQLLYDGGTFNNFPVDVMAEMGVGKVIGVDVSGEFGRRTQLDTLPGTMALLLDKLRPRKRQRYRHVPTVPETMLASSFVTSLSRQREQRRFADLLFNPKLPRMGLMDWHRFEQVVDAGRTHAREVLAGLSAEVLAGYR